MLLVWCLLEHPFFGNAARDRVELRILDACSLLELGTGLGLGGDQFWARSDCGEIAPDSARLEQLKVVVLLLNSAKKEGKERASDAIAIARDDVERKDATIMYGARPKGWCARCAGLS